MKTRSAAKFCLAVKIPTQAKTGLEWATRPFAAAFRTSSSLHVDGSEEGLKDYVKKKKSSRSHQPCVRGDRGEGTVVSARCSPANQITEYWVRKSDDERFWDTLQELKAE
jgi:hypothetical protein